MVMKRVILYVHVYEISHQSGGDIVRLAWGGVHQSIHYLFNGRFRLHDGVRLLLAPALCSAPYTENEITVLVELKSGHHQRLMKV